MVSAGRVRLGKEVVDSGTCGPRLGHMFGCAPDRPKLIRPRALRHPELAPPS